MPTEVTEFLNSFQLGFAVQLIVYVCIGGGAVYAFYCKISKIIKTKGSQEVLNKLKEKENEEKIKGFQDDIDNLQKDISRLDSELSKFKSEISDELKGLTIDINNNNIASDSLHTVSLDSLKKLSDQIELFETSIQKIENKIEVMTENINVLMDADVSTLKAFIISEYQRCVKEAKEIDLISLQNIENIYKKYLAEDRNGGDEFITSLVREIRNLPTHK
jgi:cell division protein FtsB